MFGMTTHEDLPNAILRVNKRFEQYLYYHSWNGILDFPSRFSAYLFNLEIKLLASLSHTKVISAHENVFVANRLKQSSAFLNTLVCRFCKRN